MFALVCPNKMFSLFSFFLSIFSLFKSDITVCLSVTMVSPIRHKTAIEKKQMEDLLPLQS